MEFINKVKGNFIIIFMVIFFLFLRFKVCLMFSLIKYLYFDIICCLIIEGGVIIMEFKWDLMNVFYFFMEYLFVCGGNLV